MFVQFLYNFCFNFERSDHYCVPLVARGKPITFLNTNNTNFTNIFCWARSQANSRKRLTNRTRSALPLATNGTQECGSCDIFERFVASSDAFILHVLNKTDSSDSLDSCSLIYPESWIILIFVSNFELCDPVIWSRRSIFVQCVFAYYSVSEIAKIHCCSPLSSLKNRKKGKKQKIYLSIKYYIKIKLYLCTRKVALLCVKRATFFRFHIME